MTFMFQIKIFGESSFIYFSKQSSPLYVYPPSESLGTTKTTYSVANSLKMDAQICIYDTLQLMHVNSQWDLEYKELNEAFRRYRMTQSKQKENTNQKSHLREAKEAMSAEIRELKGGINEK